MDATMMRLARRFGCMACAAYKQAVTVSGPQGYGYCVARSPRTTGARFPSVMASDHCGEWTPIIEIDTEAT